MPTQINRRLATLALVLQLLLTGLFLPQNLLAQTSTNAYELTPAIPGMPVQQGAVYFSKDLDVDFKGGVLALSSSQDGQGRTFADDGVKIVVDRPDGSSKTFSIVYESGCASSFDAAPSDISSYFIAGINHVHFELFDVCGFSAGSNAFWFVGAFSVIPSLSSEEIKFRADLQNLPNGPTTYSTPQYIGNCIARVCVAYKAKMLSGLQSVLGSENSLGSNTICTRLQDGEKPEIDQQVICGANKAAGGKILEDLANSSLDLLIAQLDLLLGSFSRWGKIIMIPSKYMIDKATKQDANDKLIKSLTVDSIKYIAPEAVKAYLDTPLSDLATDQLWNIIKDGKRQGVDVQDSRVRVSGGIVKLKISFQATYNPDTHYVVATIGSDLSGGTVYLVRYEALKNGQPADKSKAELFRCTNDAGCEGVLVNQ